MQTPFRGPAAVRPALSRRPFSRRPLARTAIAGIASLLCLAAPGLADTANAQTADLPPLRQVQDIDNNMLWVGIAIEISDRCETIDPRTVKGLLFLNQLRSQARRMGYSNSEIEDYATSDEEQARWRKLGEAYAISQGLDPDVDADTCKLGYSEIERNSQIGVLLRAK